MKFPIALILAAPLALFGQESDPLKSAACAQALATLQQARSASSAAAEVQPLRDRAAQACLGGGTSPQRSARVLQAPVTVPPPVVTPPPQPAASLIVPVLPPPPVAIQRPPRVSHCDAGGCWADDGRGVRHVGPGLAGPQGLCTRHGGLVYCP